jgi:hypothetical protein
LRKQRSGGAEGWGDVDVWMLALKAVGEGIEAGAEIGGGSDADFRRHPCGATRRRFGAARADRDHEDGAHRAGQAATGTG